MRRSAATFLRDRLGSSAAEFALVLPLMLLLVFGVIQLSTAMYAASLLRATVEEAARCASVKNFSTCGDPNGVVDPQKVRDMAAAFYKGPGIGATFVYATDASCGSNASTPGHRVTGSGSYSLGVGAVSVSIPMSATACFPAS
jgi:hypothetical protein